MLHYFALISAQPHYTLYCRKLSADVGVSIRVLDQALWQYSKEKQGRAE